MLIYKAKLYGRTIKTVDKYFPSSQICSSCQSLHPEMKNLGNKQLVCKDCGTIIDRDYNAAINMQNRLKNKIKTVGTTGLACNSYKF